MRQLASFTRLLFTQFQPTIATLDSLLIPMEDDAYLTEHGYEFFRPYQTSWYLIR